MRSQKENEMLILPLALAAAAAYFVARPKASTLTIAMHGGPPVRFSHVMNYGVPVWRADGSVNMSGGDEWPPDDLVDFLERNPQGAQVWKGALPISFTVGGKLYWAIEDSDDRPWILGRSDRSAWEEM
ncbi:MAG: hypothetical protein KIT41_14210 [Pyrinomonadaceae bacterium]|nr:hypothetical protein [Pyrinomonadaceae bacterium]